VSDHPVCAASEASRLFLTGAATPPHEEGDYPLTYTYSRFATTLRAVNETRNSRRKLGFARNTADKCLKERAKITSHFAEVGRRLVHLFSKFGVRPNNLIEQGSDPTENGCTRRLTQNHCALPKAPRGL
jgi:hypothetical protein